MAGSGRKVFANGNTLSASDVQNYLQDQAVMYYASHAARTSAIASPTTGMTTYVGDTTGSESPLIPQIESYTGSAWQNLGGLVLLSTTTFTSQASVKVSSVFNTTYDNYKILIKSSGNTTGSTTGFVLYNGATALGASSHYYAGWNSIPSAISFLGSTGASFMLGGVTSGTYVSTTVVDVMSPALAETKTFYTQTSRFTSTQADMYAANGIGNYTTTADSFQINFGGTTPSFSGIIRVYGMRNA